MVEPRPGLDHARNRAVIETTTDVLAFTDDDVVVDPGWSAAIARAFAEEPQLGALTGLVLPLQLATPAQQLFERLGGFGKGFVRRWETRTTTAGRPRTAAHEDIVAAAPVVHRHMRPTPLYEWPALSQLLGCRYFLKHENHTPTTAFKVRGGLNLIARLPDEQKRRGIIACTTGNHGQSLAFACRARPCPCRSIHRRRIPSSIPKALTASALRRLASAKA